MDRRLPSLTALLAFEAAARHRSFTRAGRELHVTQSAISHQIRALEGELGVRLFTRLPRALKPTAAGERLGEACGEAFDRLAEGLARLSARRARTLTISVLPSFASRWLLPRLGRFTAAWPRIDLKLQATQQISDLEGGEADAAIRFSRSAPAGLQSDRLLSEEVFPVCTPALARRLRVPSDLRGVPLLHDEARGAHGGWAEWLEVAGAKGVDPRRGASFSDASLLLQAALDGQGVAIGRSALAAAELRAGRLVRPFRAAIPSRYSYWFAVTRAAEARADVRAFRAFLLAEARKR